MLHLLAHGSITVGPDLQPVFQTLLLVRGAEGQVCLNTHCAVSPFGSRRYLEILGEGKRLDPLSFILINF